MKELYIAPELQVMIFAPVENIASSVNLMDGTIDAGNLMPGNTPGNGETHDSGDISLIIPKN